MLTKDKLKRFVPVLSIFVFGMWVGGMLMGAWAEGNLGSRTIWEDAVLKSPNKVRPHINASTQYFNYGRYARALDEAQTVIRLKPESVQGYINAMSAAFKLGAYKLTYEYSLKVMEINPRQDVANNLAVVCKILGKEEESKRWLELAPTFSNYKNLSLEE